MLDNDRGLILWYFYSSVDPYRTRTSSDIRLMSYLENYSRYFFIKITCQYLNLIHIHIY